jgi:F-type H+-transporting ATPase subunit b
MRCAGILLAAVLYGGVAFAAPPANLPADVKVDLHTTVDNAAKDVGHAAEEIHEMVDPHAEVAGEVHEKSGPPQFAVETFPSQLFWLAISFGSMYLLFAGAALPRIAQGLEARSQHINALLDDARRIRDEAEKHKDDMVASTDAAYQRAHDVLNRVASEAQDIANRRHHELEAILATKQKASEERIAGARSSAVQSIREASHILLPTILAKLADLKLSDQAIVSLVDHTDNPMRGAA